MLGRGFIRKRRNETPQHFLARLIYFENVLWKFANEEKQDIVEEYPRRKGARADLVILNFKRNAIEIWTEVQETPLIDTEWKRKLNKVATYKPKRIDVVLTENSAQDLNVVKAILEQLKIPFKIFAVNTEMSTISEMKPMTEGTDF